MKPRLIPVVLALAQLASTPLSGQVPAESLLVHLPLTNDLKDHSPSQHWVTVSGKVSLREGAAYFRGQRDWLELPHLPLNDRAFAVGFWVRLTGDHPIYGLVEQRAARGRNQHFHLMLRGQLQPRLGFYLNDVVSPVPVANGKQWTHLLFQYTGTRQQIWINGRLIVERTARPYGGTSGKTYIGRNPRWRNVPARDFEGYMSDFRIYSRFLSGEEIANLARPMQLPVTAAATQASARPVGAEAQPRLGNIALPSSASIPFLSINQEELTIHGVAGQVYELQSSKNLEDWFPVATVTNRTGSVRLIDRANGRAGRSFYRVLVTAAGSSQN